MSLALTFLMQTIIESLKYATTGEMPAGTGKGQNFIHDPKLTTKKMVNYSHFLYFTFKLILNCLTVHRESPADVS